jgi:SH3-like domain-containing protein
MTVGLREGMGGGDSNLAVQRFALWRVGSQTSSKGSLDGQGEVPLSVYHAGRLLIFAALLAIATESSAADRATPSGLPVPRYVSLKFNEVNARAGPSNDQRLLWVYRARGLPMQVVAESSEWRRVCDPEGNLAWVHARTVDGRRTVMRLAPEPLVIRKSPNPDAPIAAYLQSRAVAALIKCDKKGWCKVRAGGVTGWTLGSDVWGLKPPPQCVAPPIKP